MGIRTGIGGPWRAVLLLAVGGAGGATAIAVATVPGIDQVISACYKVRTRVGGVVPDFSGPNLRIIDTNAGQTCSNSPAEGTVERSLSWNVQGQRGQAGSSVTVASGGTLTLPGGNVVTVGGGTGNTYTITSPPFRPSGQQVTLDLGTTSVPILGFNLLSNQTAGGGGGGAGKVKVHDISISKLVDKSSPKLALACVNGKHFATGRLTVRKAGGRQHEFLTYKFSNVLINSYQSGGHGNGDTPTESFTLNFTKISISYTKQ